MSTPRIDTVRNTLDDTIRTLEIVRDGLPTLHELAWTKPADTAGERVAGGQPDYALDRHGDPRARAAFRQLAPKLMRCLDDITEAAGDALAPLRGSDRGDNTRHPAQITARELDDALAARARRRDRGEYSPAPAVPQGTIAKSKKALSSKIAAQEAELRALRAELRREKQLTQRLRDKNRGNR